jgi:exopolysaccharide biosynthesis polyprenyl glycosylphosphotransferase
LAPASLVNGHRGKAWWRDSLRRRLLALADLTTAFVVALMLVQNAGGGAALRVFAVLPLWIVLAKLFALYDRDHRTLRHLTVDDFPRLILWVALATIGSAAALRLVSDRPLRDAGIVSAWIVGCVAAVVGRTLARFAWRRLTPPERTLIIGDGRLAEVTRRKLDLFVDMHLQLVGHSMGTGVGAGGVELPDGIDRVVVACQPLDERLLAELIPACRKRRVKLSFVPPVDGMFGTAVQLDHVADLPVVQVSTWDVGRSTMLLKRLIDVAAAAVALVTLTPLFALIAAAIKLDTQGPVLFSQRRAGLGGKPFGIFKFRTMVANAEAMLPDLVPLDRLDEPVFKLSHDPRITRVGRFLRRASLDELPQLVNVLKGDMSLVGPRPEQVELVERYTPEERFRLAVKPGLTGPMQVFGRGRLTLHERLALERDYIENLSLGRDLRILALTVAPLLTGRGAF